MPEAKEPHYFANEIVGNHRIGFDARKAGDKEAPELSEYLEVFEDAEESQIAGEASVYYLWSEGAAERIRQFSPKARIIAMLRNPADLIYSMHSQHFWAGWENASEFEAAWDLQKDRAEGKSLPPDCFDPLLLQYREIGRLGTQLQRYFNQFDPEQILVIFMEDFHKDTADCYNRCLDFLGLECDGRTEFPVVNPNKQPRSKFLQRFIAHRLPGPIQGIRRFLKRTLRIKKTNILNFIQRFNTRKVRRKPLGEEMRQRLNETFSEEIDLLEKITARDLGHWRS